MYCPDCGLEDKQANQFCRACGSDLRTVRSALERPDSVTASAASARDEIGRAIAAKIRETRSAEELSVVTEEVLPEIEKFLESPAEKRLRRMRAGMILSSVGLGTAIGIVIASIVMKDDDLIIIGALGVVAFFIGIGFILNGVFLTVPKTDVSDRSFDADRQRQIDGVRPETRDLALPEATDIFSSVTEHTTKHLKEKQPIKRD